MQWLLMNSKTILSGAFNLRKIQAVLASFTFCTKKEKKHPCNVNLDFYSKFNMTSCQAFNTIHNFYSIVFVENIYGHCLAKLFCAH